jgi:glutamate--cysteine ligase
VDWAAEILDQMLGICELLDAGDASKPYSAALAFQRAKLADFGELPSARLLDEMERQGMSFAEAGLWMSRMHRDYFRELYPPNAGRVAELREEAAASLEEQRAVESRDSLPFAEFVARYTAGSLV